MKPIVIKKQMNLSIEPTWCAHCCGSIIGGDNVLVLKHLFGPSDLLCSEACAHAEIESIMDHGGMPPCVC